nr:retrovirus-related Pol polyprotein from transposon TNT 1-94 [Tanacetum cinerariifolium]
MPPTPDLYFTGLDEFVNELVVENCKSMSSEEEPKVVRKYDDAPRIEECVSDDEEENVSQPKIKKKTNPKGGKITRKGTQSNGFTDPKSSHDDGSKPSSDDVKKVDEDPRKESKYKDQEKEDNVNNTNNVNTSGNVNTISSTVNAAGINKVNAVGGKISIELPFDPKMAALEDDSIFDFSSDDEDVGAVADMNNLDTTIQVSLIPTIRIHKDHPLDQVIRDLQKTNKKDVKEFGGTYYEEIDGGYVAFGENPKGEKITGKDPKSSHDDGSKPSSVDGKKVDEDPRKESECNDHEKEDNVNSTNNVNTAEKPDLEDDSIFNFSSDDEDDEEEPKKASEALKHPRWVDAMQEELNQFSKNKVWTLVPAPYGKTIIGSKWVYRNKRDETIIVIKNKARHVAQGFNRQEGIDYDETFSLVARLEAIRIFLAFSIYINFTLYQMDVKSAFLNGKLDERGILIRYKASLVAQGYTQEERIDYDEVFAPVVRIKAIRLFLAYASFKYFVVYQMDVKSAFLYGKIKEEVYVCQLPGFEDLEFPDRVYKVKKALYGLHQAPRAWFTEVKTTSTSMESQKPMLKDENGEEVNVHMYRSIIGSLMYLTSSGPDIMFAVCACARYQVNPSDYARASLDRKSTTGGYQFLGCRLISWQCKKLTVVANSTTEAEYVTTSS